MKIENYLGFPMGITGAELTGRATLQAQKFGADLSAPSAAASIEADDGSWSVELEDGQRVLARCVLIATGADYRRLDVPGREEFESLGVYYAATQTELSSCRGYETVVVGAGNAAGQAAMFLAEHTNRVHVVMRGSNLRDDMSDYLAGRIEKAFNIEVHPNTVVRRFIGDERVQAVEVESTEDDRSWTIETPAVFMFIGAEPRTAWVGDLVEKDAAGFICTGRAVEPNGWTASREPFPLETSRPGIFAAGDARAGSVKRVTSAVGEGSMVVKYVHEHLAGIGRGG
jgi:thioredoxin reductase (NADPH)